MSDWSARQYLRFQDERTRAASDLLAQIPLAAPETIVDIGCGPGNSTAILARQWPSARISGFDSSPDMLREARERLPAARFFQADAASWQGEGSEDLLFANAVFQWVPDHLSVLERLLAGLKAGAVLAVQIPDDLGAASHIAMRETAEAVPWRKKLANAEKAREIIPAAGMYYDRLRPMASHLDLWRTEYQHSLAGIDAIVEWFKGTGLRPFLNPLSADERHGFLDAYRRRLELAFPLQADGSVLLPFPRRFIVAIRG